MLTARDSGRRAGRGGVTAPPLWREQIGQLASRRLWRQKVGTNTQSRTAHQQLAGRGLAVRLSLAMVPGLATTAGAAPGVVLVDSRPALGRRIFAAVRPGSGRRAAVAAVLAALTARAAELGG